MLKNVVVTAALAACASMATAADGQTRLVLALDLGLGGDTLVSVRYTDGSTQDLKAGDGLQLKVGLDYTVDADWAVVGTVGYQIGGTLARNGNIYFERFPLELLVKYNVNDKVRVGAGLRLPLAGSVHATGDAASLVKDFSLKGKKSLIVDAEYRFNQHLGLGLRFANDKYEVNGKEVDGRNYGLGLNAYF